MVAPRPLSGRRAGRRWLWGWGGGVGPVCARAGGGVTGAAWGSLLSVPSRLSALSFAGPFLVPPARGALAAVILLTRSLADLPTTPVAVEGELLRLRTIGDRGKQRSYAAGDDGNSARIRAFIGQPSLDARLNRGELGPTTV